MNYDTEIIYHHVNVTNRSGEIEFFKNISNTHFIVGIEVTIPTYEEYCTLSIDPQHSPNQNKITSIEYIFNFQDSIMEVISKFEKIVLTTVKTDVDSIGTMAIITLLLTNKLKLDGDLILRLKAIAKSDRHGRKNWKNQKEDYFNFEDYNTYGLPSGLPYMISDHKITIEHKVKNMIEYLVTGNFNQLNKYNNLVYNNLKQSNKNTTSRIIVPKKLSFIESNHRGGVAYGYKFTPCVIAKNPNYVFGQEPSKIIGKKITIAQYSDSDYIDLIKVRDELNLIESDWGGSNVIIGSPLNRPTTIPDETIIEICKKHIL